MLPASSKGDSIEDELNCVDACLFFRVPDRGSVNFFGGGTNRASRAVKDETGENQLSPKRLKKWRVAELSNQRACRSTRGCLRGQEKRLIP